jgi:hypothetical protein
MRIILPRINSSKIVTGTETVELVTRYPYQVITSDGRVYSLISSPNANVLLPFALSAACTGLIGWFSIANPLLAATVASVAGAVAVVAVHYATKWVENYTPLTHKTVTMNDGRTVKTTWV